VSSAGVPEEFQTVGAATGKLRWPSSVSMSYAPPRHTAPASVGQVVTM